MKRILVIAVLFQIIFGFVKAASPTMYIYRNDKEFNKIDLTEGVELTHDLNGLDPSLIFPGSIVPISVIDSCIIRSVDIPTVNISLVDYPEVTMLWEKDLYLNAMIEIDGKGLIDDVVTTPLRIKGRGNSSWGFDKKPMRLKFDKKIQIGSLKKAKNIVLLANYSDPTLMKNTLMMWLAAKLDIPYCNHAVPCNVYINGSLAGSYIMTEKVGLNSGSVDDIEDETGVLLELDTNYDENYKFMSGKYDLPVMIKDPDFDELYEVNPSLTPEQRLEMWRNDFNKAENAAQTTDRFKYFDLDSFVDYYLVCNLCGNDEIGWPKSLFVYKRSLEEGQLYHFGPLWDFDISFGRYLDDEFNQADTSGNIWLNALMINLKNSPEFKARYAQRLKFFVKEIYPEMIKYYYCPVNIFERLQN